MDARYGFWLESIKNWTLYAEKEITSWSVTYDKNKPAHADQHYKNWTTPTSNWRRLVSSVTVPSDDACLIFDIHGEGLLSINGIPTYGINPFHTQFRPHRAADDTFDLQIDQVTSGLMGTHVSNPGITAIKWASVNPLAEQCYWDLLSLLDWIDSAQTPADLARWTRRKLDWALSPLYPFSPDESSVRAYVNRANRSAEEETLYQTLKTAKIEGLAPLPAEHRDVALEEVHDHLTALYCELNKRAPKSMGNLLVMGHAHIDLAWLWSMDETRRKITRTVAGQRYLLDEYPDWKFGMSSPEMWQMLEEDSPELFEEWRALTNQHRVVPLGAFWVESDAQLFSAVSILRHLTMGIRAFQKLTGRRVHLAFLPDTFGFSQGLPTLLAAAGIDLFLTTKINWNDTTPFPYKEFCWIGPDGSSVQAQIFGSSRDGYNGTAEIGDLQQAWARYAQGGGEHQVLYAMGHGDGGGGPTVDMLEKISRYNKLPLVPNISYGDPETLILPADQREKLPHYRGDLYLQYHRGVFTTQSAVKNRNRYLEAAISATEAWASLVAHEVKMDRAWRLLLRSQFHDILPGSAIHAVYNDYHHDMDRVESMLEETLESTLSTLFPSGPDPVLILGNHTGFPIREQLIEVQAPAPFEIYWNQQWRSSIKIAQYPDRYLIPIPAMLPMALASYPIRNTKAVLSNDLPHAVEENSVTVCLQDLSITIAPCGINQMIYKGRNLLDHPARIHAFFQHPDQFDAWELVDVDRRGEITLSDQPIVVEEDNPYRIVVKLTHTHNASIITERIVCDRQYHRVTVRISMLLKERHLTLQYHVPTTLITSEVTRESVWGTISSPTVSTGPADDAAYEWVAHRFIDLAEPHCGLALINDGRYGHSATQGTMTITLATTPLFPDSEVDEEPVPVNLMLMPHDKHWTDSGVMAEAHRLSHPPLAMRRNVTKSAVEHLHPIINLSPNIMLIAVKRAEDESPDLIYYFGEMWGDASSEIVTFPFEIGEAHLVDLVSEKPLNGNTMSIRDSVSISMQIAARSLTCLRVRRK